MQGLEKIYSDLDSIRKRTAKLVEMNRIDLVQGSKITGPVVRLMEYINGQIELKPEEPDG